MEYSLSYVLILVIYIFLFVLQIVIPNSESRKRIRLICAVVFILFFGFRGFIGSDWYNYQISYELTSWNEWLITDYELGFSILMKTLKLLNFEYFNVVFVITLFQVFLFDRVVNLTCKNVVLPYILVIALFPIVIIDLQRNFISILLAMNGFLFFRDGKMKMYYFFILLALSFHTSAIVYFFIPVINRIRFSNAFLVIIFLIGLFVYFFQINFYYTFLSFIESTAGGRISYLISQVTGNQEEAYGVSIGIIEKIILFILIIVGYNKVEKENLFFVNCAIIYILVYLYFSTSQSFINRFANLFMFGYIWYYSYLCLKVKNPIYQMYFFTIILFCVMRTFLAYNVSIYDYKNVLFDNENYYERLNQRSRHYE